MPKELVIKSFITSHHSCPYKVSFLSLDYGKESIVTLFMAE